MSRLLSKEDSDRLFVRKPREFSVDELFKALVDNSDEIGLDAEALKNIAFEQIFGEGKEKKKEYKKEKEFHFVLCDKHKAKAKVFFYKGVWKRNCKECNKNLPLWRFSKVGKYEKSMCSSEKVSGIACDKFRWICRRCFTLYNLANGWGETDKKKLEEILQKIELRRRYNR